MMCGWPLAPANLCCRDDSPVLPKNPPEAKVMAATCWVLVAMDTKDMHLCMDTKYWAALRGPDYGYKFTDQDDL